MGRALDGVEALDGVIEAKVRELGPARRDLLDGDRITGCAAAWGGLPTRERIEEQAELHGRVQTPQGEMVDREAERSGVARDVPAPLRIEEPGALRAPYEADRAAVLREAAEGVLAEDAATRGDIEDGDLSAFRPWTTCATSPPRAGWVADRASGERRSDVFGVCGEALLDLGLAEAGTVASGGLGLAAAGLALGAHGAVEAAGDHPLDRAGSNTALDPSGGLLHGEGSPGAMTPVAAPVEASLEALAEDEHPTPGTVGVKLDLPSSASGLPITGPRPVAARRRGPPPDGHEPCVLSRCPPDRGGSRSRSRDLGAAGRSAAPHASGDAARRGRWGPGPDRGDHDRLDARAAKRRAQLGPGGGASCRRGPPGSWRIPGLSVASRCPVRASVVVPTRAYPRKAGGRDVGMGPRPVPPFISGR